MNCYRGCALSGGLVRLVAHQATRKAGTGEDGDDIFFIYVVHAQDIDFAPSTRSTGFQTGDAINVSMV